DSFDAEYKTASGRVAYIKRLHPKLSEGFRAALRDCRPLPSDKDVTKLRRRVVQAVRTRRADRDGIAFRKLLDRLSSEAGGIRHARPNEAERLLRMLRIIRRSLP